MEQFVPVPLSVYNSSDQPTIVAKKQIPKYKPEQTPTYHKDTLKRKLTNFINFKFFDAASITPDLVINRHAKGKERGAWIPFKL